MMLSLALLILEVVVTAMPAPTQQQFRDPEAPYAFDYPSPLVLEKRLKPDSQLVWLRDYTKDDNFRGFLIEHRSRRLRPGETVASRARELVDGLMKAEAYDDVRLTREEATTLAGKAATHLEIQLTHRGGHEYFTRPDGEERHTEDRPLALVREVWLIVLDQTLYQLTWTSEAAQREVRRSQIDVVLQSLVLRP
jgi:hypothetical protein